MGFNKGKIEIAYRSLEQNDVDMWIVAGQESATKSEPVLDILSDTEFIGKTALIFTKDHKARVVCTPIDANGYVMTNAFDEVRPFPISFVDTLAEVIAEVKPKNIALDYSKNNPSADGLSVGMYQLIQEAVKKSNVETEVISAEKIVTLVRGIKTEEEIEKIKRAVIETEIIFNDAKEYIRAGMNCQDVYRFFQNEVERKGFGYSWPKSQNPGVVSGIGCPQGHVGAPDFVIKKGDVVNVDFGIVLDGYASDIQRMYYMLKDDETDAPEDVKAAFYAVRDGILLAAKALKPGVTGNYVDSIARDYITNLGYPSWNAALGHQIGKVAHDGGPILGPRRPRYNRPELIDSPLYENMCFTLEPGVPTSAGRLGLEEDVVVRKDGAEFLVPPQMELYLIK
ncbi:MAG: Xaa-Pro peptidase family protein [Erysipelotrichaceae bacterium]|nr:Xaa-Pro peptidase family protein [Erysipelotrichaceae bacterium]